MPVGLPSLSIETKLKSALEQSGAMGGEERSLLEEELSRLSRFAVALAVVAAAAVVVVAGGRKFPVDAGGTKVAVDTGGKVLVVEFVATALMTSSQTNIVAIDPHLWLQSSLIMSNLSVRNNLQPDSHGQSLSKHTAFQKERGW